MAIKKIPFLIIALFATFSTYGQTLESQFQQIIDSIYQANPKSVGIMVHVEAPDQNVSWSGAVGYSDAKTKTPIEPNQPALIASSIKTYISVSILRLVEEGKLTVTQPIQNLLTRKTRKLFANDGYDLETITVAHLLSHTSGISDYVDDEYFDFVNKNPKYRWTRKELYERAVKIGNPLGKPGISFRYADVNFVLLGEIIEKATGKPFYTAIRELLRYETLNLNDTWFPTLESKPKNTKDLVHQYWGKRNWDSYNQDNSWDLYGGGGIAATTADLAQFSHHFFNGKIVKDKTVQDLIFTEIKTKQREFYPYFLGLYQDTYHDMNAFGHGGFWGTQVLYFPTLKASISVYILDKDKGNLRRDVLHHISKSLQTEVLKTKNHNAKIKTYLENITDFSGTILVAHQDKIIAQKAAGLASIEFNAPNNLDTKFNIASITKTITAVATLQLYEKGLVKLDKPIGTYLPNYPNQIVRDSVTIHQLLTHTSGLKPFYGDKYLEADKLKFKKVADFLPLFVNDTLLSKPGTTYYYSGSGFVVLGLIIEQVTGQNYYDYVEENIFKIANMNNSLAIETDSIVVNKASGYTSFWGDNDYYTRNDYYTSKASPAGSHYSTVSDLFNFSKALRNHTLLQEKTTDLMTSLKVKGFNTHLGYGIDIDKRYDEIVLGHSGGWFGVRCEWMDFMASDYTIIVLSNQDGDDKSGASKVIEDLKVIVAGEQH